MYSHSMKKIDQKAPRFNKPFTKKSVDWSLQTLNEQSKQLEPIVEQLTCKKVKEVTEIQFSSGQLTCLRLRFKYMPEYITLGQKVIINELKLVGKVKEIYY